MTQDWAQRREELFAQGDEGEQQYYQERQDAFEQGYNAILTQTDLTPKDALKKLEELCDHMYDTAHTDDLNDQSETFGIASDILGKFQTYDKKNDQYVFENPFIKKIYYALKAEIFDDEATQAIGADDWADPNKLDFNPF